MLNYFTDFAKLLLVTFVFLLITVIVSVFLTGCASRGDAVSSPAPQDVSAGPTPVGTPVPQPIIVLPTPTPTSTPVPTPTPVATPPVVNLNPHKCSKVAEDETTLTYLCTYNAHNVCIATVQKSDGSIVQECNH